ncbi:nuclear pore complex protein Nup153 isoform X2 [Colias croceus]|uniref:nuclear pore complex protein Nup153 isoform X2 n=1 Tax=Colias crocea TaxID=72248 RepID=UPI001E27FDD8|nr:nuclear pore complex protein Nup153 isoform X2 [Colias croceus]
MNSSNREKRPRESCNTPKSFVQNVKSKMSELLPKTITKWFSSPSSSSANGSATLVEVNDSSTEDEGTDCTLNSPPKKRLRRSLSVNDHFMDIQTKCTSTNTDAADIVQSPPIIYSSIKCKYHKGDPKFMSTPLHAKHNESTLKSSEVVKRVSQILKHSLYSSETLMAKAQESLFNSFTNYAHIEGNSHSEQYKDDDSYNKSSLLGSTFYPGQTIYGGTNSPINSKATNDNNGMTELNKNNSSRGRDTGRSTKHLLDLLDSYASPLVEARRISQYVNQDSSFNTSKANTDCKKVISYKTKELAIPSMASVISLKKNTCVLDITSSARQLAASHSSTNVSPYPVKTTSSQWKNPNFVTKIKNTRLKSKAENINNYVSPAPLDLPPAVLQIEGNNLPKFSFDTPTSKKQDTLSASPILHTPVNTEENINMPEDLNLQSPIISFPTKKSTSRKNDLASTNISNWKCNDCWVSNKPDESKCVCCGGKKPVTEETTDKNNCSACLVNKCLESSDLCTACKKNQTNNIIKSDLSKWKCNDCWVSNNSTEDKCVCCGGEKPGTLSSSSEKYRTEPSSMLKVGTSSKWKCEDCWVSNDDHIDKCLCCGATNPAHKTDVIKSSDKGWKCNVCMLENFSKVEKCIACLTSNPDSSSASKIPQNSTKPNFQSSSNDPLKKIIKSQSQKWECQYCLVHNDNDKSRCVCCDSEKPGATKQSGSKFNFGISPNISFKFGIDPKMTEKEKVNEDKSHVKGTNNNEIPKATFTFGILSNQTNNVVNENEQAKIGSPIQAPTLAISTESTMPVKISFAFGIPKDTKSESVNKESIESSVFASKSEKKINENPQEVPNVESANCLQFSSKLFTYPQEPSVQTSQATATSGTLLENSAANISSIPVTISASSSANFFKPASSTVDSTSFIQPADTSVNFITPPLFQKNTIQQSSTSSLFQKTNAQMQAQPTASVSPFSVGSGTIATTVNSTTTQSSCSSAPVFSFKSNNQMLQTEKPKFNYTFGANRETTTNIFTSSIEIRPDNLSSPTTSDPNIASPQGRSAFQTNIFSNIGNHTTSGTVVGDNSENSASTDMLSGYNNMSQTNTRIRSSMSSEFLSSRNSLTTNLPLSSESNRSTTTESSMLSEPLSARNTSPMTLPAQSTELPTQPQGLFGAPSPGPAHEPSNNSTWSSNNIVGTNLFANSKSSNIMQKPVTFSFGNNNMSCNVNMVNNSSPLFGGSRPSANSFMLPNQSTNNSSTPSMFSTPLPNQTPNMFGTGSLQPPNNTPPGQSTSGLFGQQNVNQTFGNSSNPLGSAAFTFGSQPAPGPGIWNPSGSGFGQPPQGQQVQQVPQGQPGPSGQGGQAGGVYSFGSPQVQFSVGSAPSVATRRVRKAVRRTQR